MLIKRNDITLIALGLTLKVHVREEVAGKVLKIETVSFPTIFFPGDH